MRWRSWDFKKLYPRNVYKCGLSSPGPGVEHCFSQLDRWARGLGLQDREGGTRKSCGCTNGPLDRVALFLGVDFLLYILLMCLN
ncbi:hypothetical protein K449DRAFT_3377 [Hypoxylon sp. EC38]|nr:hypothetical protein K449DRAFT_3377 [Hypoxylon sp. EC38]